MIPIKNIVLFLVLFLIFSCKDDRHVITEQEYNKTKDALVGVNRILVKKDREKIKGYIERREPEMMETETGLWYKIYNGEHKKMIGEQGTIKKGEEGKLAIINYQVSLLDGTICYSSDESGPKEFIIGKGGVESGLEEGILMLYEGDSAKFIMPPHLAYGLTGDGNKIPKRAIIIYDLEVLAIKDN